MFVAVIDFKIAFDSAQKDKLWHTLSAFGLKGKLLKVIKGLNDNVTACVRSTDGNTKSFECNLQK